MRIKLKINGAHENFDVELTCIESIRMVGYFKFDVKCFGNLPVTWDNVLGIEILETY